MLTTGCKGVGPIPRAVSIAIACLLGTASFVGVAQAADTAKPVKPAVLRFTSRPAKLSFRGGRVTLAGTVAHASICRITASPAMAGFPKTTHCVSGDVRVTVELPKNKAPKAKKEAFALRAIAGAKISGTSTSDVTVGPPFAWSGQLEPPANGATGQFDGVSCASARFCVAVDSAGNEVTWNGTS